jgi:hypothetical protein
MEMCTTNNEGNGDGDQEDSGFDRIPGGIEHKGPRCAMIKYFLVACFAEICFQYSNAFPHSAESTRPDGDPFVSIYVITLKPNSFHFFLPLVLIKNQFIPIHFLFF